jgi:3-phosphoshikimate 1-carboxyvinyltransferase
MSNATNDALIISPASAGVRGEIVLPGDKSISHRAVMFSAIARESHIRNFPAVGIIAADPGFRTHGIEIVQSGTDVRVKETAGMVCKRRARRLIAAIPVQPCAYVRFAGWPTFQSRLDGDDSLRSRPMARVMTPLRQMGADIRVKERELCAIASHRGPLQGIDYHSQVAKCAGKIALMLAGLQASGHTAWGTGTFSRSH